DEVALKLRPKLAVTLVAIVIPVLVVFTLFRISAERRDLRARTADRVAARLEARGAGRCLREPERFHMNRRGFQVYSYGPDYRSANPQAPPLPGGVVEALRAGEETASKTF